MKSLKTSELAKLEARRKGGRERKAAKRRESKEGYEEMASRRPTRRDLVGINAELAVHFPGRPTKMPPGWEDTAYDKAMRAVAKIVGVEEIRRRGLTVMAAQILVDAKSRGKPMSSRRAVSEAKALWHRQAAHDELVVTKQYGGHDGFKAMSELVRMQASGEAGPLKNILAQLSDETFIRALADRTSTMGALMRAHELVIRKSEDYNQQGMVDRRSPANAQRDDYFPFGDKSYIHMLHVKSKRLVSLALKDGGSNFEGMLDTALDLINYAAFYAERLMRERRDTEAS